MLAIADHHLGNTNFARSAERLVQDCVRFLSTLLRLKEIRLVEKLRIDLPQINEIGDVDRMRGFDAHLLEVFILHHDIMTALEFEALYDLIGWNFLRVGFRHLFVSDRTEIAGTKLPETKLLLSGGGINRDWNVNQPEADAAFPDRTHTGQCFPIALSLSTLTIRRRRLVRVSENPCNSEKPSDVAS